MKFEIELTQAEYDEIAEDAERHGHSMQDEVRHRVNSIVRIARGQTGYLAIVHDSCCIAEAAVACTIAMISIGRMARLLKGDSGTEVGALNRDVLTNAEAKAGGVVDRGVVEALWHVAKLADRQQTKQEEIER